MHRVALAALVVGCHRDSVGPTTPPVSFNAHVLSLVEQYPAKGGYVWPAPPGTAGTTRDLVVGDAIIAKAGTGTHCVGITLEVFWRALAMCKGGVAAALDATTAADLKRRWYVPELGGRGAADALAVHHLGIDVGLDNAQPGDFVQAWNADGTFGHSMIFIGRDGDTLRYWSSQPWTDGIGFSEATLGTDFDSSRVHVARAACQD
jgi:hypothetical protein